MQYRHSGSSSLPPVVKNLLIVNVLVWLAQVMFQYQENYFLDMYGPLYPVQSGYFQVWQPITYMFMHDTGGLLAYLIQHVYIVDVWPDP